MRIEPPHNDIRGTTRRDLLEVDEHHGFARDERLDDARHLGHLRHDIGLTAIDRTLDLGGRPLTNHDHIVGLARTDQGLSQACIEHQNRRKDIDHERHTQSGQYRGEPTHPEVS